MREPEQVMIKPEMEENKSNDHISKEVTGEEPLAVSRIGENPAQFVQLLDALDNQENNNLANGIQDDDCAERNEQSIFLWDGVNAFPSTFNLKETIQCLEMNEAPQAGTKSKPQQIPSLTAPEAVLPLNQAAADTNSETEKYLLGWPFFSPYKVQLLNCEKCSLDLCSVINYRRHIRGHRKSLNMEKDSLKNRVLLGAYWDKLSLEEARKIVSLDNASIEGVTGTSVLMALTSAIRKPGFLLLPHIYVKAGSALLDIVGEKASAISLSSEEFFSVLDDASENTFLFGGDVLSLQKYIFGGNAGKIALESRNLIACVSLMLEQELLKAWIAHKDIEALRCQQLLMEEEEAAQRRQADLLERRRLKKLRQKEKKLKDLTNIMPSSCNAVEVIASDAETSIPRLLFDNCLNTSEASFSQGSRLECTRFVGSDMDSKMTTFSHAEDAVQNLDQHQQQFVSGEHSITTDYSSNNSFSDKIFAEKFPVKLADGFDICTREMKLNNEEGLNGKDSVHKVEHDAPNKHELVIGSIIIKLENDYDHNQDNLCMRQKSSRERQADDEFSLNTKSQLSSNNSEPVCHDNSNSDIYYEKMENEVSNLHTDCAESIDHNPAKESCLAFGTVDVNDIGKSMDSPSVLGSANSTIPGSFSRQATEAFIAQRWKEGMAADHVTLTFVADHEASIHHEPGANCV